MPIEKYASLSYPLGEVEPTWHDPRFDTDIDVALTYKSHDDEQALVYPGSFRGKPQFGGVTSESDREAIIDNLRGAVSTIDGLVRDHRGYEDTLRTKINVDYRVGLGRASGFIGLALNGLRKIPAPFVATPGGIPHTDDPPTEDDYETRKDTVLVTHRGAGTLIFEGPVYGIVSKSTGDNRTSEFKEIMLDLASIFVLGRLSRIAALPPVAYPNNTAVLIDGRTLHQQPGEVYRRSSPPVWMRAIVQPLPTNETT